MNRAVQRAAESKMKEWEQKADFLVRRYSRYVDSAAEVYQEVKRQPLHPSMKRNLAIVLDNTRELIEKQRFMEQSYSSDVAFTNYAFDIVSVILPSLIAEEIVSIQAMERRTAEIFFMNILADKTKGSIATLSTVHSAKTGWTASYNSTAYASGWINGESRGVGNGTGKVYSGTLSFANLVQGSTMTVYTISGTTQRKYLTGTVGSGTTFKLLGSGSGTITKATGGYVLNFQTTCPAAQTIYAVYKVDLEKSTTAIGKIKVQIASETVRAETLKLNSEWLMDSAYDLLKAHGRDAEKEVLIALTGEVKAEIDAGIILDLYNGATATSISWDKAPTSSGVPWIWHKNTLIDVFIQQSNYIYTATRRAVGNFIVMAPNISDVVLSLDQFESAVGPNQELTGAYYAGMLSKKWKCYVSPDLTTAKWVMGYMGESYLKAGYVYAPYLPLFTTPTYTTMDFISHKGLGSSYGTKMINGKMYSVGTMSNPSWAF